MRTLRLATGYSLVKEQGRAAWQSATRPDQRLWSWTDSNRRHLPCKGSALPTELQPHMVGLGRLELPTSRLSGVRSNQAELQAHTLGCCRRDVLNGKNKCTLEAHSHSLKTG